MAKRAAETFITAANTLDGRRRVFRMDEVVPDDVAQAVGGLVYDDGAPAAPAVDGTPDEVTCDVDGCDYVGTARGLAVHAGSQHKD